MPLLKSSPYELFYKASIGKIAEAKVEFIDKFSVGVVMASKNYPFSSSSPSEIVIDEIHHKEIAENTLISYAGVSEVDGKLYATGGRVLVCVGVGESIKEARDRAYMLVGQVHFAGKRCRMDIAYQALGE
jgi:phosphoribosylamine--glycine ligase